MARPVCTPANVATDASTCASSSAMKPARRLLGLDSGESGSVQSIKPSFPKPSTSWKGNSARAQQSSTIGATCVRRNARRDSTFSRSLSDSSSS